MNLPGQREFIFEPGGEIIIPVSVQNARNIDVFAYSPLPNNPETLGTPDDDNIMEYVTIEDPAPNTSSRTVVLRINMPEQLRPGYYYIHLIAKDIPTEAGAAVSAVAETQLRFTIWALSPEKVVDITGVSVPPIAEGLDAKATIGFVSRTQQDIPAVYAEAIVSKDGQELARGRSGVMTLPSAATGSLEIALPVAHVAGGEYSVHTTLFYGEQKEGPVETLKIGTLHVGVEEHTPELVYNTTNRFMLNISNQWNRELQSVYARVQLGGQVKTTASQHIQPFGKTEYEVYFDRDETIMPGSAAVNATIWYKDYDPRTKEYVEKQESFLLPVAVVLPPVPEDTGLDMKMVAIYSIMGLLIILLLIALAMLLRRSPAQPTQQATQPPATPPAQSAPPQQQPAQVK